MTRYFVPRFAAVPFGARKEDAQARYDEITAVLEDSVAKHMRADVTVGAFLSGASTPPRSPRWPSGTTRT